MASSPDDGQYEIPTASMRQLGLGSAASKPRTDDVEDDIFATVPVQRGGFPKQSVPAGPSVVYIESEKLNPALSHATAGPTYATVNKTRSGDPAAQGGRAPLEALSSARPVLLAQRRPAASIPSAATPPPEEPAYVNVVRHKAP
jgi:hypothetical protein